MGNKRIERFLRDTIASFASDWLTTVPYQMSGLRIEKVGFAEIPVVFVTVICPQKAVTPMVPVVRQFVFRELEAAGIENEIVEFVPTVQDQGRRRRFVDCNEHSPTKGKNKVGQGTASPSRSSRHSQVFSIGAGSASGSARYRNGNTVRDKSFPVHKRDVECRPHRGVRRLCLLKGQANEQVPSWPNRCDPRCLESPCYIGPDA